VKVCVFAGRNFGWAAFNRAGVQYASVAPASVGDADLTD
jgi:hypothetical protein